MKTTNLTVAQLKALVTLADTGSFTLASERLHVTQPAISHAIRQIEEMLQQPLFERQRDRTTPNAAGLLAVKEARLALIHMERLEYAVKGQAALESGTLRLGCFASAAHWLFPSAVAEFARRYPSVDLHLVEAADDSCALAVMERRIDLGMVNLPCSNLWTLPIFDDNLCIVASSNFGAGGDLKQYENAPFLYPRGALEPLIEAAFVSAGFRPRIAMSVVAHSASLTLSLLKTCGGYTLMPYSAVADQDPALVVTPVTPGIVRRVAFAAPSQETISPAARAFLDILTELRPHIE